LACGSRLRASSFAHTRGISLVLRLLPVQCPRLETLGAPPALSELLAEESGLLLVTGATGSGKSTTLAAMVGHLNQHLDGHILTLEDPVEFIHHSERCLIQQREIGRHCPSFSAALRVALRQDPDVILLGELRDSETIRLALTAAETGHLVMATLHTRGAAPAVERLIDVFPAEEKDQVRSQLAGSLCAVLAQKLLPARQGGRVALYELLVNTPAVANLIREGKVHQLPGVMQTGMQAGMLTFTQSFQQRVATGQL
ncbi:twitching motility protein PilT, partial [Klebsiella quasipneumoniae]